MPAQIRHVVMLTCPSCGTTLYLDGTRLENAGASGEMHDAPALFGIGDSVQLDRARIDILGHARFSYGRGWWDEYWGQNEKQTGCWISVDEGDVVLQYPIPRKRWPQLSARPRLGLPFMYDGKDFAVTEIDVAECVALRGAFGEVLEIGETYRFFNAEGSDGALLSGEFWDGGESWFVGYWHDPFEVTVEKVSA